MGVRHDQLDTAETTRLERTQELGPERFVLGVTDVEAEDFTAPISGDTYRDDNGLGHDPVVHAGLAIRRIQEHVRECHGAEVAAGERADFEVQVGADAGDFGLGDPGVGAEGFDQVVDLPGRDAMQIRFHHDSEQSLVDPAAALQQGREERPSSQLRDPKFQIAGRGRQCPGTGAVALRGAVVGAFILARANQRGRFGIDQFLIERFGHRPDPIRDIGEFELGQQIKQGRLVKSHRVLCP